MISMDEIVRAARLAPSVGPFTIRRLMFRAGIFNSNGYSAAELKLAMPGIETELREILGRGDLEVALRDLGVLIAADERRSA